MRSERLGRLRFGVSGVCRHREGREGHIRVRKGPAAVRGGAGQYIGRLTRRGEVGFGAVHDGESAVRDSRSDKNGSESLCGSQSPVSLRVATTSLS